MWTVTKMLIAGAVVFVVAAIADLAQAGCGTCDSGKPHKHEKAAKVACEKCAHTKVCDSKAGAFLCGPAALVPASRGWYRGRNPVGHRDRSGLGESPAICRSEKGTDGVCQRAGCIELRAQFPGQNRQDRVQSAGDRKGSVAGFQGVGKEAGPDT